jgi:hypothetical protein
MNNRDFAASDKDFIAACRNAGIPPTQRQASKYRLKSGKAYQHRVGLNPAIPDECFAPHVDNRETLGIQVSAER